MLCVLDKTQLGAAADLYAKAYNVNAIAATALVESFASEVFAQKNDNVISAILCATKFDFDAGKAVLLHGIAGDGVVQPNIVQALIKHAKESMQADHFFAIGADDALTEMLAQDMDNKIVARLLNRDIKRNLWAKADFDTITAKKLCKYREKFVQEKYAQLSIVQVAALLTCLYSQGISSAETDKAYALYFRTADSLAVVEIYAETDVDAWFLLEAMADRESRNRAQLLLSESNTIFAGEGKRFNYASYSHDKIENNIYIGPMPK